MLPFELGSTWRNLRKVNHENSEVTRVVSLSSGFLSATVEGDGDGRGRNEQLKNIPELYLPFNFRCMPNFSTPIESHRQSILFLRLLLFM